MLLHDWPVPDNVAIAMTDRHGGVSLAPYDSLNLGLHVGDAPQQVLANRGMLAKQLCLATEPVWLEQVHGTQVVDLVDIVPINLAQNAQSENVALQDSPPLVADASYTDLAGRVCVVMTADCLPVLLCNQHGTEVAAAHAGWRGLCDGVIEASVAKFASKPSELIAYLGPAIGPETFEVGAEVRAAFMATEDRKSVV